jgi:Fe2+ or Zn2+ uptake regulation protein
MELKQADLQVTPARIAMLKLFEKHDESIDAQHLIEHLQIDLGIDRVTVFRILNAFVAKGLISKLEFGEGKARYELSSKDHYHVVCPLCRKVVDEKEDSTLHSLLEERAKKYGYSAHELKFTKLCEDCKK